MHSKKNANCRCRRRKIYTEVSNQKYFPGDVFLFVECFEFKSNQKHFRTILLTGFQSLYRLYCIWRSYTWHCHFVRTHLRALIHINRQWLRMPGIPFQSHFTQKREKNCAYQYHISHSQWKYRTRKTICISSPSFSLLPLSSFKFNPNLNAHLDGFQT